MSKNFKAIIKLFIRVRLIEIRGQMCNAAHNTSDKCLTGMKQKKDGLASGVFGVRIYTTQPKITA